MNERQIYRTEETVFRYVNIYLVIIQLEIF